MFGMSFMEIMVIAIIAVLFLGPDKLPSAMVQVAKFFKSFKSSINEAKSTFEQEIKLQELREDSLKYKKQLEEGAKSFRKKLT
ncbi:MAG: Sec-independent protein translocase protein TatB, partial [Sulfurospirillaceae bacterium]